MSGFEADWVNCLEDERAETLVQTLRSLELTQLQKYPAPKTTGLPVGHELLILRRFLSGGSTVLYESALSRLYRLGVPRRVNDLFEAFVLNRPLARRRWDDLLGSSEVAWWLEQHLLEHDREERLICGFQVIPVDGLVLLADSPKAVSNLQPGQNAVAYVERPIHEFLQARLYARSSRALDVGPGAGMLTLDLARMHERCEAVELNPRAALVASFNVRLNGVPNCHVFQGDIFAEAGRLGAFDTITWNAPFIFLPEEYKEGVLLAYGGELGVEITLRFLESLPSLMADDGVAYVASAAPILSSGENHLINELTRRAAKLGQDVTYHRDAAFRPDTRFAEFYRQHGIARFETVFLEVRRGTGRISLAELGFANRALDRLRRWAGAVS